MERCETGGRQWGCGSFLGLEAGEHVTLLGALERGDQGTAAVLGSRDLMEIARECSP